MSPEASQPVLCRGIRGATTVPANERGLILTATQELLQQMATANHVRLENVASIIFTTTPDLTIEYPAAAARQLGWTMVPLLCMQEINHPDGLPYTIRVLMHYNTTMSQADIQHVYINGAEVLRPDFFKKQQEEKKR